MVEMADPYMHGCIMIVSGSLDGLRVWDMATRN